MDGRARRLQWWASKGWKMTLVVEVTTVLAGVAVGVATARAVLTGILAFTFGRRV
jgi:hypothetical protein